jgi:ABC-type microcin C transport system permease subunit YejE
MNQGESYKKLISRLPADEPSSDIITAVLGRIKHARIVRARLHAALHGSLIILAIIAFIPAVGNLMASADHSGFSSYVSLIVSDGSSMLGAWQPFVLSIVDSAPILEIGIILGLLLIFANSLRRGSRYVLSINKLSWI